MPKNRRSATWFYVLLVVFVISGYVLLQFAIFGASNCTGRRVWVWDKFPPGFVCQSGPVF